MTIRSIKLKNFALSVSGLLLALGVLIGLASSPFADNPLELGGACDGAVQCSLVDHARLPESDQDIPLPLARTPQIRPELVITFAIDVPDGGHVGGTGLCIPRSPFLKELKVDGRSVQHSSQQASHGFLRPHHVQVMPELMPGRHALTLSMTAPPGLDTGLSKVWVGGNQQMARYCNSLGQKVHRRAHNITWVMAALGLMGVLLWFRLRDPRSLTFAFIALTWVVHLWVVGISSDQVSKGWWTIAFLITRVGFVFPMVWYALQITGRASKSWLYALICTITIGTSALLLLPHELYPAWLSTMSFICFGSITYAVILLLLKHWKKPTILTAITFLCYAFVVSTNWLDFWQWTINAGYGSLALTYLSVPILCVVFGYQLIVSLINVAEHNNYLATELQKEVEKQQQKISIDFEKIQRQREQLAVVEERRRLVRDMHDGLGSQLISMSARIKNSLPLKPSELELLLESCIRELRNVLDVFSLEPETSDDDPVASLLGNLRWRMAPALEARGIHLSWACDPLPQVFLTQDTARLNLVRFWQEAFTNVLKHSQARHAYFKVMATDEGVVMSLDDDGRGFDNNASPGIGLKSMKARAATSGAVFAITSRTNCGTSISLIWKFEEKDNLNG